MRGGDLRASNAGAGGADCGAARGAAGASEGNRVVTPDRVRDKPPGCGGSERSARGEESRGARGRAIGANEATDGWEMCCARAGSLATVVTDATFEAEVLKSDVPVLVDFWAPWCGPCRMIAPLIDQLAEEYQGKLKAVRRKCSIAGVVARDGARARGVGVASGSRRRARGGAARGVTRRGQTKRGD